MGGGHGGVGIRPSGFGGLLGVRGKFFSVGVLRISGSTR